MDEATAVGKKDGKWNLVLASECVRRNGGIVGDRSVKHDLPGLKVLGAIDYLVNYCKFRWVRA